MGEEEGSGSVLVGDIGLGEVGGEGEGQRKGATGDEDVGSVKEGVGRGRKERRKIRLW